MSVKIYVCLFFSVTVVLILLSKKVISNYYLQKNITCPFFNVYYLIFQWEGKECFS